VDAQKPPPQAPAGQGAPQGQDHPGEEAAGISGAPPPPGQRILSREERVEYRDQNGKLLNEEEVKALEGKVEFKTRYETRTRVVDANGNEIPQPGSDSNKDPANPAGVAPPHPDVDGAESKTPGVPEGVVMDEPIKAAKESVEGAKEEEASKAKPASEGNEATKQ
jgi:dolichyl-phosphate-mannose-protein mannosyltransferase